MLPIGSFASLDRPLSLESDSFQFSRYVSGQTIVASTTWLFQDDAVCELLDPGSWILDRVSLITSDVFTYVGSR